MSNRWVGAQMSWIFEEKCHRQNSQHLFANLTMNHDWWREMMGKKLMLLWRCCVLKQNKKCNLHIVGSCPTEFDLSAGLWLEVVMRECLRKEMNLMQLSRAQGWARYCDESEY